MTCAATFYYHDFVTGIQVRRKNLPNSRDCKLRDNRVSTGEISLPKVTGKLNESRSDTRDKVFTRVQVIKVLSYHICSSVFFRSLLRYDGKLHKDDERDFVYIRVSDDDSLFHAIDHLIFNIYVSTDGAPNFVLLGVFFVCFLQVFG